MRNTEKVQENTENMQQTAQGVSVSGVSANALSKEIVGEAFRLPWVDVGIVPYYLVSAKSLHPAKSSLYTRELCVHLYKM